MTPGRSRVSGPLLWLAASASFLVLAWFDASPLLRGPEPYPPEWQWRFRDERVLETHWLALLASLGLLSLLVISGMERARSAPRRTAALLLTAATILGLGLQTGLVALAEDRSAAVTLTTRTASPYQTGYFAVALSPAARDPVEFLRNHAQILPWLVGRTEHTATHPPGAILYFRGVLALCEALPTFSRWLLETPPGAAVSSFYEGERAPLLATALLSPLLLMLLSAAVCWPVAVLARCLGVGPLGAARVGVLWSALPGPTLQIPTVDQLVTFLSAMAVALLGVSLARSRDRVSAMAVAAGLFGGLAIFVSYGGAIFVLFGGLFVLAAWLDRPAAVRRALPVLALSVAAALAINTLPMLLGHDPIESFRVAMGTHFGRYTLRRSYPLWLGFNLWDLAVFVSIPVALLGIQGLLGSLAALRQKGWWGERRSAQRAAIAAGVLLLLLDVSGLVRGEIGRSWMPIMPFLLVAATTTRAAAHAEQAAARGGRAHELPVAEATALLALLLAHCWVLRLCWRL